VTLRPAVTVCRACGARIIFIKTVKGKTMPVDAEPVSFVPDDNGFAKYVLSDGIVVRGVPPLPGDRDVHEGYISHFATCPSADAFRKNRKSDRKKG